MIRLLTLLILAITTLSAQSSIVSGIPLPKTYVLNLDPYECDETCLQELMLHEQVFSLLARMPEPVENPVLNEQRLIYVSLFNLDSGDQGSGEMRIALLLPERVIGRYAASTTNSALTYLISKNRSFELKTFKIGDESADALEQGLNTISSEGFHYVIAPLTKSGAEQIASRSLPFNLFIPTVNRNDINASSVHLYFGGIDYRAQIKALMREAEPPLVVFYDRSALGTMLNEASVSAYMEQSDALQIDAPVYSYPIDKHTTNLKSILKDNKRIVNGTFILNTPLIKSAMIMSQLTLYDVNASRILSTQINYGNMLFDITQEQDRTDMIVANSVTSHNNVLIEENMLLQNDIQYDWINYATTLGTDYFYHLSTGSPREFGIPMEEHQLQYPVKLYHPVGSRFEPYESSEPQDDGIGSWFKE